MCVLLGYGADAICPFFVFEMAKSLREEGVLEPALTDDILFKVLYIAVVISFNKKINIKGIPLILSILLPR